MENQRQDFFADFERARRASAVSIALQLPESREAALAILRDAAVVYEFIAAGELKRPPDHH